MSREPLMHALSRRLGSIWCGLQERMPAHVSITYKLALTITLLISGGMVLLGAVIIRNQTQLLQQQMNSFGHTVTRQLADAAKEPLLAEDRLSLKLAVTSLTDNPGVLGAAIFNAEGKKLVSTGIVPKAPAPPGAKPFTWEAPATSATPPQPVITFGVPILHGKLVVGFSQITFDLSVMEQSQEDAIHAVTVATLLMIFLGGIASFLLGRRLSRPIHSLLDASRAVAHGNFSFRIRERRNDELGTLMESFNTMSEGLLRKEHVERAFSRYVSPNVAQELMADLEEVRLGGKHVEASVLFADIVGFTTISEQMRPSEVNSLLNEYFGHIAHAAQLCQGHVDKYIGDCAMVVFGVPGSDPDHAFHALVCALLIQRLVSRLNQQRQAQGAPTVHFRIGVNSGTMMAGNMGSAERMEYTVVGDAVNLASRLSDVAEADQIIVTETLAVSPRVVSRIVSEPKGTIGIRGKSQPQPVFLVTDVVKDYRPALQEHLNHLLAEPGTR